jgi:hypothetical protein
MRIDRSVPRAGVYAEERYERGLQSWRRKLFPLLAFMFGPLILAGVVILCVERQYVSWFAGMISGVCMGVWIWVRDSPPHYVEKWHDGAEGERKTEKALRPLEKAGWTVVHDVQKRYGNYDHIAVGPTGVYLLETKNLRGIVSIRDGMPILNRRHDPDDAAMFQRVRPQALGAAASIKNDIQRRTGHCIWVQAVIVFWPEFPEELVEDGPCVYIHGQRLRAWLAERPRQLDPEQVAHIVAAIERLADEHAPHH